MNIRQILLILRLRWWLVLLILLLVVSGTLVFSLTTTKRYLANTSIILDMKTDPLVATLMPALAAPAFMATQTEIIRSERVSGRVVRMMGLAQSPAAVGQWRDETDAKVPLEIYFGQMLQKGLAVTAGQGSQILNIAFMGTDPQFAAAAANTFAKAYIDLSVELRTGPAREYGSFFEERLKGLKTELEAAQAKVADFQQANGMIITADRYDAETARLASLETALAGALAELAQTSTLSRNAGTDTSVDVNQSGAVQGLRAELARSETKLSEISAIVGSSHPTRIQLEAQITELRRQIAAEQRRVSGTTQTASRISSQKIGELRTLVETQKRAVLDLRKQRDAGSTLVKDLEVAQRAYDAVQSRRSQLTLESAADQAGARVLSPATAPYEPASPNIPKNMVAALIVGLLLGVAAAMAWEFLDRRVRSEADMTAIDGVPVLSVLSAKPGRSALVRRLPPPRLPPQLTMSEGAG